VNTSTPAGDSPADDRDAGMPCPGLPRGADDEPVFHAPWQAQAFAMTLQLHARGLFTWPQWAAALSARLATVASDAPTDPQQAAASYYGQWLAALEDLVQARRAGTADELQRHASAWDRAAHRTPHGLPIELRDEDFAP
jgi:nitrile hydratase accessory protein